MSAAPRRPEPRPSVAADPLLGPQDVAAQLGVPLKTVRDWRHRGVGPASFRVGGHVRYRQSSVDAFVAEREAAEQGRATP